MEHENDVCAGLLEVTVNLPILVTRELKEEGAVGGPSLPRRCFITVLQEPPTPWRLASKTNEVIQPFPQAVAADEHFSLFCDKKLSSVLPA